MNKEQKTIIFLFLVLVICAIFVISFENAYGLDKIQDDYINETRVQAKNDIVRNTTFDCMELEYDIGATKVYEDFTTWTETDALNRLSQTALRTTWTNLRRDDDDINLWKDFTVLNDWYFEFKLRLSSIDVSLASYHRLAIIGFSNVTQDFLYIKTIATDGIFILLRTNNVANEFRLLFAELDGGTQYNKIVQALAIGVPYDFLTNTNYYLSFNKTGLIINIDVFSDSARTIQIANCTDFSLHDNHNSRYVMCPDSVDYSGVYDTTGYIENLWTGTTVGGYEDDGYFYTTELISGIGGNTIVLLTNATIPSNDIITVEFSPNNITWVDHNGNIGSDTLIEGNESIDIRDIGYTNLNMRFNYTDVGADSTPRLYQIIVITDAFVGGGVGATVYVYRNEHIFLILFIVGIASILIIGVKRR